MSRILGMIGALLLALLIVLKILDTLLGEFMFWMLGALFWSIIDTLVSA